jgi:uncharacterized protein
MKKALLYILFSLSFYIVDAQRIDSVQIIVRPKTDKVLIRWQPNNEVIWSRGITSGYYVERKTVERNGVAVSENYLRLNSGQPVVPWTRENFQAWLETTQRRNPDPKFGGRNTTDSIYHLVSAMALFKDTSINRPDIRPDSSRTVLRGRYDYAIMGAAFSYSAAKMSGLGFVDNSLLPNEKYQYRILLANIVAGDDIRSEVTKTVGLTSINTLPIIPKPRFKFKTNMAELDWTVDTLGLKEVYIGYNVERSYNTVPFTKINRQFLVKAYRGTEDSASNFKNTPKGFADVLGFRDTTIVKKITYYYRIVGKTLFDEFVYSAPISGSASPEYAPTIKFADMISATSVRLNWEFLAPLDSGQTVREPNEIIPVKKYFIERGANDSTFVLVKDNISPTDTTVVLDFPKGGVINADDAHYLRITAVPDLADAKNFTSGVVLVQPIDSIAPFAPIILDAKVRILSNKELGEVTLTYKPDDRNTDVVGYHIFRSDRAGNEMVQISDTLQKAIYKDTINTTLLNDVILYRVLAVDKRGNRSPLSDSIVVQRPDIIPPTAPIIKNLNTIKTGVELRWIRGKDRDQNLSHSIFKKLIPTDSEWTIVVENLTQESDTVYVDKNVLAGKRYVYIVVATDKSNNKSISTPRIIDVPNSLAFAAEITSIKAYANRTKKAIDINWETKGENFSQFQIYRAIYPNSLASWNIISGEELAAVDRSVDKLVKYRYAIRGVLADGSVTRWITTDVEYPDDCETNFKLERNAVNTLTEEIIDEACEQIILLPGFDSNQLLPKVPVTPAPQVKPAKYKTKLSGQKN